MSAMAISPRMTRGTLSTPSQTTSPMARKAWAAMARISSFSARGMFKFRFRIRLSW